MGWFRRTPKPPERPAAPTGEEGRRAPRFQTAVVNCMLGQVTDLSSCGMCVISTSAPPLGVGDLVRLELQSPKDELLVVGRVARIQRRGPVGYEIGVEFQQLTPELSAALDSLARHGCIKIPGRRSSGSTAGGAAGAPPPTVVSAQLPDLYALLGVGPTATEDDIHRAFREQARKVHPDLNPSAEAHLKFIELHKAYDILKCPEKRRSYDAAMFSGPQNKSGRAVA
ncbi:MAG: DnaJ domain-containing protein [Phycisphaerales bacterium]